MSPVTKKLNGAAKAATDWIGSVSSLVVHTILFAVSFSLVMLGFDFEKILLVVTTVVSLEAIYLAIFIQMAINQQGQSLEEVEKDVDKIQGTVEEIHEDVEEIQEDVDEIQEDVEEIQEDVEGIEKDVDEIQKDVDEIEKDETEDEARDRQNKHVLDKIEASLGGLIVEIEKMKKDLK
jgi:septal ring factor EnvC (AmiA/AmiB activator)